ncbi:MAG: 3-hydroxyacyl-ACP dehydratase FabZ [Bacteroidales bacterium]|jgi:3-hydroxyacyl-[acyl-carrier-protein] dehydratase|nr:3-hydroxyacyl-ACP dehydratase FabZ [Bacteroidales bacterium]
MNREEIKKVLPHREPMLLLDSVEIVEENLVHAEYLIKGDEFFLQGHYPGNPVVPGVILCEIMAQSSSLLLAEELVNRTPLYAGIDKIRFKKTVRPGDNVHVYASIINRRDLIFYVKAEAKVDGKTCVKGDLIFALIDNEPKP